MRPDETTWARACKPREGDKFVNGHRSLVVQKVSGDSVRYKYTNEHRQSTCAMTVGQANWTNLVTATLKNGATFVPAKGRRAK
jgi:hypothetical protein